jgi:hypothetical protein
VRSRNGVIVLVLLTGAMLASLLTLAGSLRERLDEAHAAAAEDTLHSVAATLLRAHELGVPLGQMIGLEELVRSRVPPDSGIGAVTLLDAQNRLVWRNEQPSVASAKLLEATLGSDGRLRVELLAPRDSVRLLRVAGMLLAVAIALALPLLELTLLFDVVRERFSERYLRRQTDAIRRGDLRMTWRPVGVGSGDVRLHFLRDQVLLLNERFQRVGRLVGSLQRTEPDAGRREQMSALLEQLGQRFRFAEDAGRMDQRVWPLAATARCFAVLILVLANLSLGGGGTAPYSPTAAPYSALIALLSWGVGLVLGNACAAMRWSTRLRIGVVLAVLANLLMIAGARWGDLGAHLASGLATCLAASAAFDAARTPVRRVTSAMLLAGTVAGPALGLASIAAFSPFATARWLYAAAATVTVIAGIWLWYRLADEPADGTASSSAPSNSARSRISRPVFRLAPAPLLCGLAWSAAVAGFIAQSSGNREQALRLVIVQLPGLLLLAYARRQVRTALAVALLCAGAARLAVMMLPALAQFLSVDVLNWAGAACMAGAFGAPRVWRVRPTAQAIGGFGIGVLMTLTAVAWAGEVSPRGPMGVALCTLLGALLCALACSRAAEPRTP